MMHGPINLSMRTIQQCTILNVHRFSFQIKKKILKRYLGKDKIINFHENVSRRSRIFPRVPTNDKEDEARSLFRSFAKASNEQKTARRISTENEQVRLPTFTSPIIKHICERELISH